MSYQLTFKDEDLVIPALRIASAEWADSAKAMRNVAKALEQGKDVPMFAPGEDGARAARGLAETFDGYVTKAQALLERMEDYDGE